MLFPLLAAELWVSVSHSLLVISGEVERADVQLCWQSWLPAWEPLALCSLCLTLILHFSRDGRQDGSARQSGALINRKFEMSLSWRAALVEHELYSVVVVFVLSTWLSGKVITIMNVATITHMSACITVTAAFVWSFSLDEITYKQSGKYECVFETDPPVSRLIEVKSK